MEENFSNEFSCFCIDNDIKRQYFTPCTCRKNGVIERRNMIVMDMIRSMMKRKNLPKAFWGEATNAAVYLLNKAPTKSLEGKMPYEA